MRPTTLLLGFFLMLPALLPAGATTAPEEGLTPLIVRLEAWQDETEALDLTAPMPAQATGIGPGSKLLIEMDDEDGFLFLCTANFLWTDGSKTYLGTAGHCLMPADKKATHGNNNDYDRLRTHVRVCVSGCVFGGESGFFLQGSTVDIGPVVYARQVSPTDPNQEVGHDFGLIEIPTNRLGDTRAAMPVWGGPTTATATRVTPGTPVCLYGNGVGVGEVWPTMARAGVGVSQSLDGNAFSMEIASNQGDSGSSVVACKLEGDDLNGQGPVGVLTHLSPPLIVGTTVPRAIQMAQEANLNVQVVPAP